jgi:hypothetical protein
MWIRFDTDNKPIKKICHPDIAKGVYFELDKPLSCTVNDVFALVDGRWYLLVQGDFVLLNGRWRRLTEVGVPAK